ncbi:ABC transporter permease [Succinispira mobilis]|uniref:ABC transporter permease n=1 Tax=Succinispira mobilis TaxID=78120 RepID=UPI000367AEBA|nr:ABC transporter permease [Succinispira mobilis]
MQFKLEKRLEKSKTLQILLPIIASILALVFCAIFLFLTDKNPIDVYNAMFVGALSTQYGISEIIVKLIPLTICALGIAVAFRMQLWNIGAEGQFYMGALGAGFVALNFTELPAIIMLPAMVLASMFTGAVWGGIAGFLRNKWQVNEIISTLMLNYIAILSLNYLVYGAWKDPKGMNFPVSAPFVDAAILPTFGTTRVHYGIFFVVVFTALLYFLFKNSRWGYKTKVIGLNPVAANYAGIDIPKNIFAIMCISGALSGLAGMLEVSGIVGKMQSGISPGYGYTAIIIAWLAGLHPITIVGVAFLFSVIQVGGFMVQTMGINSSIATMIQGAILFFVIGADIFNNYKLVRISSNKGGQKDG